jgi:5-methylcytosine-specific restriction endonuclease McrA
MARNWRSEGADEYRKLYRTREWRFLREQVIQRDMGLCRRCGCGLTLGREGKQAAVVHHKKAHKGDLALFFNIGNLETLCNACHSGHVQSEEKLGYSTEIGIDGYPVDENHPTNKISKSRR